MKPIIMTFTLLLSFASMGWAQKFQETHIDGAAYLVCEMSVSPKAPTVPWMAEGFLYLRPYVRDGNGAFDYFRALLLMPKDGPTPEAETVRALSAKSLAALDLDQARRTVESADTMFRYLERAVHWTDCRWHYDLYATENPIAELFPEMEKMREIGFYCALKIKIALAEKRYDDAFALLRTGFGMVRHQTEAADLFLSVLWTGTIHETLLGTLREWSCQADSPNIFWPLKELPRFAPLDAAVYRNENDFLISYFPDAPDLDRQRDTLTEAQWRDASNRFAEALQKMTAWGIFDHWESESEADVNRFEAVFGEPDRSKMIARLEPFARNGLVAYGYSAEQIAAMTPEKAFALYLVRQILTARSDMMVSSLVTREEAKSLELSFPEAPTDNPLAELVGYFTGDHDSIKRAIARIDWRTDMLLFTEALRWYAAEHDGKLPTTMDDFSPIPVPTRNPANGQPYTFRVENDALVFDAAEILPPCRLILRLAK